MVLMNLNPDATTPAHGEFAMTGGNAMTCFSNPGREVEMYFRLEVL